MDKLYKWWSKNIETLPAYDLLEDGSDEDFPEKSKSRDDYNSEDTSCHGHGPSLGPGSPRLPFSWLEWCCFFAIGGAMMWTWSMILVAVPYFQSRFETSKLILKYFEAVILIVFAITILGVTIGLTRPQPNVSYPKRLRGSFVTCIAVSALLTISTINFFVVSSGAYLAFLLFVVFFTALANGLCQNAAFAFVSGFGQPGYTQAIVTGEAVAGILPPVIEIITVFSLPPTHVGKHGYQTSLTTLVYFLSDVLICGVALLALNYLNRQEHDDIGHKNTLFSIPLDSQGSEPEDLDQSPLLSAVSTEDKQTRPTREPIKLQTLWRKLAWPAVANFTCVGISSIYPVYSSEILSVVPLEHASALLRPEAFIPLGFGVWNIGDLIGSLLSILPAPTSRPHLIFFMSIARIGFIPLYKICNVHGHGALIPSDSFYLFVVQLLFGITDGWLGGVCMVGVSKWVDPEEREAAGAFMGLSLVAGLTAGSLLSLAAA